MLSNYKQYITQLYEIEQSLEELETKEQDEIPPNQGTGNRRMFERKGRLKQVS